MFPGNQNTAGEDAGSRSGIYKHTQERIQSGTVWQHVIIDASLNPLAIWIYLAFSTLAGDVLCEILVGFPLSRQ